MSGVRAAHIVLLRCSHLVLGSLLACCGGNSEDAERDANVPADVSADAGNHAADIGDGEFPDIDGSDARWQRIRGDGVLLGGPVPLPDGPYLFPTPGIMVGDQTVLVREPRASRLLRLDATGAQILPWVRINQAGNVYGPSMTRLGDEVFAAWLSYNYGYQVTVARLKPF